MTEETKHKDTCQNRLLVASAVLTFLYYAGATFDGLSVAGATVKFTNQNAVAEFTWFIWLYYYFRTYQYYREAGLNAYRAALNRAYVSNFGPHLLHLPRHQFAMLPDDDAIKSSKIRLAVGRMIEPASPTNPRPPSRKLRFWHLLPQKNHRQRINLLVRNRRLHILRRILATPLTLRLTFKAVIYPPSDRYSLQGQSHHVVHLPIWTPALAFLAHAEVIFTRPQFLENQGPLILGLIPVWYQIAIHWPDVLRHFN
ncbi:hypothetical protein [Roseateles sp. BYS96W]|uniref:Uncharacterized protein n=1 Tax=Pelomonas nitida TaxID=3299027 RepID=A0ABW7G6J2_9BURK